VIRLRLPALRERREDVPSLARFFLQKSAKELGVEAKRITEAALARLMQFDFPGNVRQLENICHWLTVMAPAQVVEAKDLPPEFQGDLVAIPARVPAAAGEVGEAIPTVVGGSGGHAVAPVAAPLPDAVAAIAGGSPTGTHWLADLERESRAMLQAGLPEVWDTLTRKFEAQLIHTALEITRGRRIEAAQKLGIGRNTITRKIQELGLDD
jgi:two-component system nitrogen regulation response regulator GlnG